MAECRLRAVQEATLRRMATFMQQLTQHLYDSLYAAAPHARKHLALRLLHAALVTFAGDAWVLQPSGAAVPVGKCVSESASGSPGLDLPRRKPRHREPDAGGLQFAPFCQTLWSAAFVEVRAALIVLLSTIRS